MMTMNEKTKNWLCVGIAGIAALVIIGIVFPGVFGGVVGLIPINTSDQGALLAQLSLIAIGLWAGSRVMKK